MKTLILAAAVYFCVGCNASQNLSKTNSATAKTVAMPENSNILTAQEWQTAGVCFTPDNHEKVELSKPKKQDSMPSFGCFVQFQNDGTFAAYYKAQCGNDCFTNVKGTYKVTDKTQLTVLVDSVEYSGYCDNNRVITEKKTYQYSIAKKEGGYTLSLE